MPHIKACIRYNRNILDYKLDIMTFNLYTEEVPHLKSYIMKSCSERVATILVDHLLTLDKPIVCKFAKFVYKYQPNMYKFFKRYCTEDEQREIQRHIAWYEYVDVGDGKQLPANIKQYLQQNKQKLVQALIDRDDRSIIFDLQTDCIFSQHDLMKTLNMNFEDRCAYMVDVIINSSLQQYKRAKHFYWRWIPDMPFS